MAEDTNEPSGVSRSPKPWRRSQAERLHDLGLIAGLVSVAEESLSDALSIAKLYGVLPDEMVSTLDEIGSLFGQLRIAELSASRVSELHERDLSVRSA